MPNHPDDSPIQRSRPAAPTTERGQALVELAISSLFLLLLVMGIVDFGFLYSDRLAISNAAREGARYASLNPTFWSNAATPDSNTIQGEIRLAGGTLDIVNNDSHISIAYYDASSGSSAVYCGAYRASTGSFVAAPGYTKTQCTSPGNIVQVSVNTTYPLLTPLLSGLFSGGVNVAATAAFVEHQ
ncbi:MAG: TadE/TadG family type IV pilus assembly protein [Candidatus Dormibacteraceae bacterium]